MIDNLVDGINILCLKLTILNSLYYECQIFSKFLHEEYEGPGTLLIEPFTDMMVALKEKNLPGAVLAARASLLWAQDYVDQDWEVWNTVQSNK